MTKYLHPLTKKLGAILMAAIGLVVGIHINKVFDSQSRTEETIRLISDVTGVAKDVKSRREGGIEPDQREIDKYIEPLRARAASVEGIVGDARACVYLILDDVVRYAHRKLPEGDDEQGAKVPADGLIMNAADALTNHVLQWQADRTSALALFADWTSHDYDRHFEECRNQ